MAVRFAKSDECKQFAVSVQAMYSVDEKDSVISLSDIPRPDIDAPRPVILAGEFFVAVAYYAVGPGDAVALITFDSYAHMFGPPNDEGLDGHPLYRRGLDYHKCFEVRESSWIRGSERMNRVHIWHDPASFARYRHFIITFQDSTFECIAEKYHVSIQAGDPAEIIRHASEPISSGGVAAKDGRPGRRKKGER